MVPQAEHTSESEESKMSDSENDIEHIPAVPPGEDVEKAPSSSVPTADWSGPDDPLNPHNWPTAKRYYHVFPSAIVSFVAYV